MNAALSFSTKELEMKLWALVFPVSNGKVALGSLSFKVGSRGVLDPQPTDEEIRVNKILGYLTQVDDVAATPKPKAAPEPIPVPEQSFEITGTVATLTPIESIDVLPPPVDDDLFEDDLGLDQAETPLVETAASSPYDTMEISDLRAAAKEAGYTGYRAAHRETLLKVLKG